MFYMASRLIGGRPLARGGQPGGRVFSAESMGLVLEWDGPGRPLAVEVSLAMLKA